MSTGTNLTGPYMLSVHLLQMFLPHTVGHSGFLIQKLHLSLQVRDDDAWMKSTAVLNKEERELLFKVLEKMPRLSKLDLTGKNLSSSVDLSLFGKSCFCIKMISFYHIPIHMTGLNDSPL